MLEGCKGMSLQPFFCCWKLDGNCCIFTSLSDIDTILL